MTSGAGADLFNPWSVCHVPHAADDRAAQSLGAGGVRRRGSTSNPSARSARSDRTHGAEGVIPAPLWIVLFLSAGVIFVFMLLFADSAERAFVQATMMGGVAIVISSMLLLLVVPRQPVSLGFRRPSPGGDGASARAARRGDEGRRARARASLRCARRGHLSSTLGSRLPDDADEPERLAHDDRVVVDRHRGIPEGGDHLRRGEEPHVRRRATPRRSRSLRPRRSRTAVRPRRTVATRSRPSRSPQRHGRSSRRRARGNRPPRAAHPRGGTPRRARSSSSSRRSGSLRRACRAAGPGNRTRPERAARIGERPAPLARRPGPRRARRENRADDETRRAQIHREEKHEDRSSPSRRPVRSRPGPERYQPRPICIRLQPERRSTGAEQSRRASPGGGGADSGRAAR